MKFRYLTEYVRRDLNKKMVFISGPRQVGKTTLALSLLGESADELHPAYFNWDVIGRKDDIRTGKIPRNQDLIIFDEVHKYKDWRNLMKGYFDQYKSRIKFLVTGSARLDFYRFGGDSLLGRNYSYRLHPLTLEELNRTPTHSDLEQLMKLGGFPEPFFSGSETEYRRWRTERQRRLFYEDLRDLENVRDIQSLGLLVALLPQRTASPLSINSLREDLGVSHASVKKWLEILEVLYYVYWVPPFHRNLTRSVRKEKKLYLWDWAEIPSEGPRFENLVASHLLKYCHFVQDSEGYDMGLYFLKDRDGKELDFLITQDGAPQFAVECKLSPQPLSKQHVFLKDKLKIPRLYLTHTSNDDYGDEYKEGRVIPFTTFSQLLNAQHQG